MPPPAPHRWGWRVAESLRTHRGARQCAMPLHEASNYPEPTCRRRDLRLTRHTIASSCAPRRPSCTAAPARPLKRCAQASRSSACPSRTISSRWRVRRALGGGCRVRVKRRSRADFVAVLRAVLADALIASAPQPARDPQTSATTPRLPPTHRISSRADRNRRRGRPRERVAMSQGQREAMALTPPRPGR